MSGSSANVRSIDVIRRFRTAIAEYDHEMREALEMLLLECRKATEWIEGDRASYWPRAVRSASDRLIEAKNQLEQCQLAARPEDRRSCIDEKKNVEKAKRRLQYCEDKLRLVKQWQTKIRQEADEFHSGIIKLRTHLELDMPSALALLERYVIALEKYTAMGGPPGDGLQDAARDLEKRENGS